MPPFYRYLLNAPLKYSATKGKLNTLNYTMHSQISTTKGNDKTDTTKDKNAHNKEDEYDDKVHYYTTSQIDQSL